MNLGIAERTPNRGWSMGVIPCPFLIPCLSNQKVVLGLSTFHLRDNICTFSSDRFPLQPRKTNKISFQTFRNPNHNTSCGLPRAGHQRLGFSCKAVHCSAALPRKRGILEGTPGKNSRENRITVDSTSSLSIHPSSRPSEVQLNAT